MLPIYVSYFAGGGERSAKKTLISALGFVAGFTAVFVALGALAAIQMNGIQDPILIYGVDGSPDVKSMIDRGLIEGTAAQYPIRMGQVAAETAYRYLNGEEVEPEILTPVTMITKNNLNEFDIGGWQ